MTTNTLKPNLAVDAPLDLDALPYPMFASTKYEGNRMQIRGGKAYTRTMKPFWNDHIRETVEVAGLPDCDAEVMVNDVKFSEANGACRRKGGTPDFYIMVFDTPINPELRFDRRFFKLETMLHEDYPGCYPNWLLTIMVHKVENAERVRELYAGAVNEGFEGLVLRKGGYQFGRCGKAAYKNAGKPMFYRMKPSKEQGGVIVSVFEMMHNGNEATTDNFGRTKRSSHQENKTGKGTLGGFVVKLDAGGECRVGNSKEGCDQPWTEGERLRLWHDRDTLVGRHIDVVGADNPTDGYETIRHPRFLRWRTDLDE